MEGDLRKFITYEQLDNVSTSYPRDRTKGEQ